MKHQIMTVTLDAFLIINALPPKFLQKRFPLLFPWCICSIVYMEQTPLTIRQGDPKILETLGPTTQNGNVADPQETCFSIPVLCYHAKFGHSKSSTSREVILCGWSTRVEFTAISYLNTRIKRFVQQTFNDPLFSSNPMTYSDLYLFTLLC